MRPPRPHLFCYPTHRCFFVNLPDTLKSIKMTHLEIDLDGIRDFVPESFIEAYQDELEKNFGQLLEKKGAGNDFLGWITLPSEMDEDMLTKIERLAENFKEKADIFVVVGIGGSYLGARAVIEALSDPFQAMTGTEQPLVIYAGHHLSEDYLKSLLSLLDRKDYAMAVISKSGTTTEPAIAFRILRKHMEDKYGRQEARRRIVAITDREKGALKKVAREEGYETFVVPDDVGGRYSVLTPVGLLPIAIAGGDIRMLIRGALGMEKLCRDCWSIDKNPVAAYAAARNALYTKGKKIEVLASYEPSLFFLAEWWKQLYGESEGKDGKGIFPAGVNFTTDLHSMGQYLQDGERTLFETVLSVEEPRAEVVIPEDKDSEDGLTYLEGKRLSYVNRMAELGTMLAHIDGGVPNIRIQVPTINELSLGELIYFFEMACGLSGYTLGVNPFDQPGVEAYKKNMFALLGKPGSESETKILMKRIQKYSAE